MVWQGVVKYSLSRYGMVKYSMGKVNMSGVWAWYVLERQDIPDPIVIVGATRGRHNGLVSCINPPKLPLAYKQSKWHLTCQEQS